jgi:hypothetical protein
MGTIKKGIIGGFSGKVGPVIGSSWKGKPYMKARPTSVANPKTQGQLDHRGKFSKTIQFLSPMKNFLRVGFIEMAINKTAFNAATSYNFRHAITGSYPDFNMDYPRMLVSQGTLAGALHPVVTASANQINFSWQNNADNMEVIDSDRVLLMIYNASQQLSVFMVGGNTRDSSSQSIAIPPEFEGDEVHCYIAFQNSEATAASTSQFVGSIVAC